MASSGQSGTPQSSDITEFYGLNWEYREPEEMKRIQERDQKEWEKLVIGKCNLILWTTWVIRGIGEEHCTDRGWKELGYTFKRSDIQDKHLRYNPDIDANLDKLTESLFEWQRKGWEKVRAEGHPPGGPKQYGVIVNTEDTSTGSEDLVGDIQRKLEMTFSNWSKSYNAEGLKQAIQNIPKPERIKKVVCIGLGMILGGFYELDNYHHWRGSHRVQGTCQHTAALAIVKQLQDMTGQKVELYAADPEYGPEHIDALETLDQVESIGIKFKVCDTAFGKHEHFTKIDESTLVFTSGAFAIIHRAVSEYTRPAVMIWECLSEHEDPKPEIPLEPCPDILWHEVKPQQIENGDDQAPSVPIPGIPWFANWSERVCNMLRDEYRIEEAFPRYDPNVKPPPCELFTPALEGSHNYWNREVRMYVRKRID